jgi:hypothetical protein
MNDKNTPLTPPFSRGESISVLLAHPDQEILHKWEEEIPSNFCHTSTTDVMEMLNKVRSSRYDAIVLSLDMASSETKPYVIAYMVRNITDYPVLIGVSNYEPLESTKPFNRIIVGEQGMPMDLAKVVEESLTAQ